MTNLQRLHDKAEHLITLCREKKAKVATAESCTGGLVTGLLTEISGSSDVVDRGFVTYSNEAKNEMIGVPMDLIEEHGAVSEEVAHAMAEGALARSRADIAVSITGIAGPNGGSDDKPVGLVHFCVATTKSGIKHSRQVFENKGRDYIRCEAIAHALDLMEDACHSL
ncbi:CinA family protein [Rhodobacteraceae bacterium RKSG542]|uniref:CinA family protein n=1 Tax=Pseudovibrio flavus TaxID=2529854 RepID=UPI0012BD35F3|nr:CinA family protein [Pseudovibrio flavus]MTI16097.1 CinA family protein [Pseudovibrio flavus]